jgi:hypothetical protein
MHDFMAAQPLSRFPKGVDLRRCKGIMNDNFHKGPPLSILDFRFMILDCGLMATYLTEKGKAVQPVENNNGFR